MASDCGGIKVIKPIPRPKKKTTAKKTATKKKG